MIARFQIPTAIALLLSTIQCGFVLLGSSKSQNPFDPVSMDPSMVRKTMHPNSSKEQLFIRYQLHYNETFEGIFDNKYRCTNRKELPSLLAEELLFKTTIDTNLKILTLGDSIAFQFHETLQEASMLNPSPRAKERIVRYNEKRTIAMESLSPARGDGVVGALRINGWFLPEGVNHSVPNTAPNGSLNFTSGWRQSSVDFMLNYTYKTGEDTTAIEKTVESFDVLVFPISHAWLPLRAFDARKLERSLQLAYEKFGFHTAIVATIPMNNNNVFTLDDLKRLNDANAMIRKFVRDHRFHGISGTTGIKQVMFLDFARFAAELTHTNALLAGMDVSMPNYTLSRLGSCKRYPPSIAQICSHVVPKDSCDCQMNRLSFDGMHSCMDSVGGKLTAGLACLMQCPLQHESGQDIDQCEANCNDEFMSLNPVT